MLFKLHLNYLLMYIKTLDKQKRNNLESFVELRRAGGHGLDDSLLVSLFSTLLFFFFLFFLFILPYSVAHTSQKCRSLDLSV